MKQHTHITVLTKKIININYGYCRNNVGFCCNNYLFVNSKLENTF